MEEKKLLRIITLLFIKLMTVNMYCYGEITNLDLDFINNISNQNNKYVKMYQYEINSVKNKSDNLVNSEKFDKNEFLELQKKLVAKAYNTQGKPRFDKQILIFVSFSMPENSIKELLHESKKYDAALVIQGLVNNSFKETLIKVQQIISDNKNIGGIHIDPNLFNEYKINQVPAYVVKYGEGNNYDVVYGLGSIKEALDFFISNNAKSSKILKHYLTNGSN